MKIVVTVDPRRCVANQTCMRTAPGLFALLPEGRSQPTRSEFTEGDVPFLEEAEDSCPTGAIRLEIVDD
jgi:ferredoxin